MSIVSHVARVGLLGLTAASGLLSSVAAEFTARDRQPTPAELATLPVVPPGKAAELLKDVKVADGFDVTIFAAPPAVNYPVYVAAAPDGTLFVSSDGNGSLDRKPHLGRVLRVRDLDGDGQGDEVKAFIPDIDSPRGLVWDHDRLYLLHPPDISVFIDKDNDGVADERRTLIRGVGWTFKDRPADHASNGLSIGVDGWLYAAIGDFGFMEAVGTDGRKLQLRGGGVVRFRPDGSGMELWADGTRNILEVATSPLLDGFARDNTNDGGGWDIRLHHFSGFTQHGYPRLFKNFPDEIIQPLADYGGGSGCGAAWVDEPGLPAVWNNAPFTADWGREWIYQHPLTPKGATFAAGQQEFLRLPRVTDLDVDARSAIYGASWKGASFTWVGPDVGFIVKVTPKGYTPAAVPDFNAASAPALAALVGSPSHRTRLEASRTLLRKATLDPKAATDGWSALERLARDSQQPVAVRVAALFTLRQGLGAKATRLLSDLSKDPAVAAWAVRAMADQPGLPADFRALVRATSSLDARVRNEAAVALGRTANPRSGAALIPLLGDSDPVVVHSAVHALTQLKAGNECFKAIDSATTAKTVRSGALRVLQSLHEPDVANGVIERLQRETDPARRLGLITALCRLHFVEGKWTGDSWGTRPDTRGPFYQPEPWTATEAIGTALKRALNQAPAAEAAYIGRELGRHRIPAGSALDTLLSRAASEPSLLPAIAAQLAEAEEIPGSAIPLLTRTALDRNTADAPRAQAVIALSKTANADAWRAILSAMPLVQQTKTENNLAEKARSAVNNASKLDQVHAVFEEAAPKLDGPASLMAEVVLVRLASRKVGAPEARDAANRSLDTGWTNPKRRLQILRAAAQAGDTSRAAQFVAALEDPDKDVAEAAKETIRRLRIDPVKFKAAAASPKIADLEIDSILARIGSLKGEVSRGEQIFSQIGCNGCHTVTADQPLKGPYLGTIANVYKRRELAEAILVPNKTIAQGFVANHFELKDGSEVDGFVVREAADAVTVRTVAAQEQTIPVNQIQKRERQERSLMPEGLAAGLTLEDLASLLDYLEGLSKQK